MKCWSKSVVHTFMYVLLGVASQLALADELTGIVTVEISGLQEAAGNVYISVYDSDDTWLGDEVVLTKKVVIADALDGELVRTELQLPLGEYALSVFYDRDDDGELDTNFIGIPKEPVALSNNATAKFGPPSYEDAVFVLGAQPIIQSIIMRDI
ncbi:Uncharacterised protein [Halioglobus japonicus]|nr:Uncharacterised protein [Halioglobus japonicus]